MTKSQYLPFTVKFLPKKKKREKDSKLASWQNHLGNIWVNQSLPEPYPRPAEPVFTPERVGSLSFLHLHRRDLAKLSFGYGCHTPYSPPPATQPLHQACVCRGMTLSKVWALSFKNDSLQNWHLVKCLFLAAWSWAPTAQGEPIEVGQERELSLMGPWWTCNRMPPWVEGSGHGFRVSCPTFYYQNTRKRWKNHS